MLAPLTNQFGCGYCRQKGGPRELQALYDSRYGSGAEATLTGQATKGIRHDRSAELHRACSQRFCICAETPISQGLHKLIIRR